MRSCERRFSQLRTGGRRRRGSGELELAAAHLLDDLVAGVAVELVEVGLGLPGEGVQDAAVDVADLGVDVVGRGGHDGHAVEPGPAAVDEGDLHGVGGAGGAGGDRVVTEVRRGEGDLGRAGGSGVLAGGHGVAFQ